MGLFSKTRTDKRPGQTTGEILAEGRALYEQGDYLHARTVLRAVADQMDGEVDYWIALCYLAEDEEHGKNPGTPARLHLNRAAEDGHAEAGRILYEYYGIEDYLHPEDTVAETEELLERGKRLFMQGEYDRAIQIMTPAKGRLNGTMDYWIGRCYLEESDTKGRQPSAAAGNYLRNAAKDGHSTAARILSERFGIHDYMPGGKAAEGGADQNKYARLDNYVNLSTPEYLISKARKNVNSEDADVCLRTISELELACIKLRERGEVGNVLLGEAFYLLARAYQNAHDRWGTDIGNIVESFYKAAAANGYEADDIPAVVQDGGDASTRRGDPQPESKAVGTPPASETRSARTETTSTTSNAAQESAATGGHAAHDGQETSQDAGTDYGALAAVLRKRANQTKESADAGSAPASNNTDYALLNAVLSKGYGRTAGAGRPAPASDTNYDVLNKVLQRRQQPLPS